MKKDKLTRRKFVATSGGAALGAMIVPRHVLGGVGYIPPSDTVNFALIGCGGQGKSDSGELVANGQNLVAMADADFGYVDREIARVSRPREARPLPAGITPERAAEMKAAGEKQMQDMLALQGSYSKAKRYSDFRKLLEEQKDIDGVVVATPDHLHAIIAKTAMELGKHVYVEKPLTWAINEARVLRETARRTKVVTQMGNQGHSTEGAALINEWVQAGVIGKVTEVQVWTNRPLGFWPQAVPRPTKATPAAGANEGGANNFGTDWSSRVVNKALAQAMDGDYPVPQGLNWELFLGGGPDVQYHPIYHPFNWRGWLDWGTGAIGDMAAHLIDHSYWALGLTYPTSVEATFTPFGVDLKNNKVTYPMGSYISYTFPARGSQPPVKLTWMDGGLMPRRPDILPDSVQLDGGGGAILIGDKGILVHGTYGSEPTLFPESLREVAAKVPKTYFRVATSGRGPTSALHRMNWANAIRGKEKATCPFEYATRLTETMLLGVVAMKAGQSKKIFYDGEKGEITNMASANQFLTREYRPGWKV